MSVTAKDIAKIDQLAMGYLAALDGKNMPAWLSSFVADPAATYICISRDSVEQGLSVAFMLDDCRDRLEDRVTYITKIWAGTFQDYRTRHFIQRLSLDVRDEGRVGMTSSFLVTFTPEDTQVSGILVSGVYEDVVDVSGEQARFLSRRAILDTAVLPRYLVYPV